MITISIVMHHHHLRVLPAKGSEELVHLVAPQAGETEAQAFQAGQASVGTIMILGKYFTMVFLNIWKQQKNIKLGKDLANNPAELTSCNELFFVFT